jgi:hypothetical protein
MANLLVREEEDRVLWSILQEKRNGLSHVRVYIGSFYITLFNRF